MRTWQVGDVMTNDVAAVDAGTPYRRIVDVMTARHVSAVPVVDEDRRVLGVVSEADLLHKVELVGRPHEPRLFEGKRRHAARVKADAHDARELMTAPAVTTMENATLVEAARTMDRERVKRLPVVDHLGRLVGIVSRADLLKVHLRHDDDIRHDVVTEVLHRVLGVSDDAVAATVTDGVVTLTGRLDRRSSAELAAHLAAQVSGVVEVVDRIAFDVDDVTPLFVA
ncbi:CBS domain-containing protein [Asanoa sp. WMMD1127]|uniref:CBS domain-containing protein n=1 Tax=Asanoa sp. WMMD1127 TaxID=3016107 RepID=UPI00241809E6|nr:CBS domain-containing protein [Asanoa sp. WMMD1127]MDG4825343.1 CBS domain-containing protein [Asanoa sp. WMMD1127]